MENNKKKLSESTSIGRFDKKYCSIYKHYFKRPFLIVCKRIGQTAIM